MRVSVVVPTWRRPAGLARALAGLATQTDPGVAWEVVVVDNDAAPGTGPSLPALPVPVRCVHEPEPGASAARNRGVTEARGEIVAFLDDDVVPAPDWLGHLLPALMGECQGAGGRVVLDPTVPRPRWFNPDWMAGYLTELDLGPTERPLVQGEWFLSANAAFRVEALAAVGGFDAALGPKAGLPLVNDDIELCRRLMGAGSRLAYSPSAVVVHQLPRSRLSRRWLLRRLHAQGRSDWLMDRHRLAGHPWAGLGEAWQHLAGDLDLRRREGLWHRPVALRAAAELARFAGSVSQVARSTGWDSQAHR